MPDGLNYPSLRCVLEHMEAHTRLRLSARCPEIKKIEKSIPLSLDCFSFHDNSYYVNNVYFGFKITERQIEEPHLSDDDELLPGDIQMCYNNRPKYSKHVELRYNAQFGNSVTRILPDGMKLHEAMKKFTDYWLSGRSTIRVKELTFNTRDQKIIRIPEGLKFKPRSLRLRQHKVEKVLPILELPNALDHLQLSFWKSSYFENPVVKNAARLELECSSQNRPKEYWLNTLPKISNKVIEPMLLFLNQEELFGIIRDWIDNNQVIGKSYTLHCAEEARRDPQKLVKKIRATFKGTFVTMNTCEPAAITQIVSIPIGSTSELIVYGFNDEWTLCFLMLKVMQIGCSTSIERSGGRFSWLPGRK